MAQTILEFLNEKAGKNFQPFQRNGKPTVNLEFILARLAENEVATVQVCKSIIARKVLAWKDDPKMHMYLRPATLFNREKFASYLGELEEIPEDEPETTMPIVPVPA